MDPQDGNRERLLRLGTGGGVSEIPSVFQFLAIAKPDDFLEQLQALGTDERRVIFEGEWSLFAIWRHAERSAVQF